MNSNLSLDLFDTAADVIELHTRAQNRAIFVDVSFREGEPCFKFDKETPEGVSRITMSLHDKEISLLRYKTQFCVGYYNFSTLEMLPCPYRSAPVAGDVRCHLCNIESLYIANFEVVPHDAIPRHLIDYLSAPHCVYLAWFGADALKVGISQSQRVDIRLAEQGALCAVIAGPLSDGFQARAIEVDISRRAAIPQTMTQRRKRDGRKNVSAAWHEIEHRLTEKFYELNLSPPTCDFRSVDLRDLYGLANINTQPLPVDKRAPLHASGKVLACCGRDLILKDGKQNIVVNTRKFQSHLVGVIINS